MFPHSLYLLFYSKYDNILIIRDLNSEMSKPFLKCFLSFRNIVNEPACNKRSNSPSCIYLIPTDKQKRIYRNYKSFDNKKLSESLIIYLTATKTTPYKDLKI